MNVVTTPMDAVAALTAAVGNAQTLPSIYDAALNGLREGFGVDRASILLFDGDGVMRFKAWRGLSDAYRAAVEGHTPWTPGQPTPEPLFVHDVHDDASLAGYLSVFDRERIVSLAFFPLVASGGVIGKFMLYQDGPTLFSDEQITAGKAMGFLLGFAVERIQRIDDAEREHQRLLFALDAAHMGTWDWNLRTQEVAWSSNLERIHGLPPGTFTGTFESYASEIHPDDRARVMASAKRALEENVEHDVEYRIVAPDGTVRWVLGKGRVERDASGAPVRMSGVCMDISSRRQIEDENQRLFRDTEQLLRAEEMLRRRLTMLTDGSFKLLTSLGSSSVEQELVVLAQQVVTADAYAVWRKRGEEWEIAASRGLSDAYAGMRLKDGDRKLPFDRPIVASNLLDAPALSHRAASYAAEGIASLMSVPLALRGGATGSIVFYYRTPYEPSEGEVKVAVALGHLGAAAISNAELYTEARDANRLKDEFLATLSHELRTPLNVIAGRSRMLTTATDLESARRAAEAIDRNCSTLVRLVDDLLDVSRMTIGQVRLERKAVDVMSVVSAAVQVVQSSADAKRVALQVSTPAPLAVMGDATRIQQIIWNLLSNAVKFTPGGGRIDVTATGGDTAVTLIVRDTGEGIAPEALPHIFGMFWQSPGVAAQRQHGSLGLGLTIAKKLAELHGGDLTAESDGLGHGATFTVRLPAATA